MILPSYKRSTHKVIGTVLTRGNLELIANINVCP